MTSDIAVRFVVPLVILILAVPLIRGKVSRNHFYGFRTPRTLSSDAIWYPANRASGLAFGCAGVAWLLAGLIVPLIVEPDAARRWVLMIGLMAVGAALVASFVALWRFLR